MDNTFDDEEKLYRAVYPPSHPGLFWKKDGRISPSAFADPKGLSVERGYYRKSEESKDNNYHSEVHGSDDVVLLSKSQRFHLAEVANEEYMEE